MKVSKAKTINLVVKVNGEEVRRWPVTYTATIQVEQHHWWSRPAVVMTPTLTVTSNGEDWTAFGDDSELTVDIPIRMVAE